MTTLLPGSESPRDEASLVRATLADDQAAWREIVNRFSMTLRRAVIESGRVAEADVDDLLSDFWFSLIEDDKRRLRSFDPNRGASFLTWLSIRLLQVVAAHASREAERPEFVSLQNVKMLDDRAVASPRRRSATLLRVEEVAERWDLNPKTVYAMIARGELVSRRCGRVVRIPRNAVESFEQASVAPDRKKPCR